MDSNAIDRRKFVKGATAAGLAGIAGCLGDDDDDGDSGGTYGFSTYYQGGAWNTAFLEAIEFYAEDIGMDLDEWGNDEDEDEELQNLQQGIEMGVEAILLNTWGSESVNPAIEQADDEGIPVFTANVDATTDAVTMYVAFSNEAAGEMAGEELVERARENHPDKDTYEVLEVFGAPEQQISDQRSELFVETLEAEDDFEIVDTVEGEFLRDSTLQAVEEWITANDPPDAIYTSQVEMGLGAVAALENLDLDYPKGEEDHITLVTLDADYEVIEYVDEGIIDAAVDQPNYFYGPIAMEYMRRYVEGDGMDEIPEVGETVTEDDFEIPSSEHMDVELWEEPIWAPAEIVEKDGHVHFQTAPVLVDDTNANEDFHWGNIWG